MKNIKYLDHPYWIHKCLNIGCISIPYYIFLDIYFPEIFTDIGWMLENINFPLPTIQISMSETFDKSQMSETIDVPAGCSGNKFCIILCSHNVWNPSLSPNLYPSSAVEISHKSCRSDLSNFMNSVILTKGKLHWQLVATDRHYVEGVTMCTSS